MDLLSIKKAPRFHEKEVYQSTVHSLDKGAMDRFGSVRRPLDVKERLKANPMELDAYIQIKVRIEGSSLDSDFRPDQVLRVIMYHKCNVDKSLRLLKHMNVNYWNISVEQLEAQLSTHTLFPLPRKLKSKDSTIKAFFYMKPSRFVPSETPTSAIIANLVYVMDSLDHFCGPNASNNTIGFIANMNDWTMKNFSLDYCMQFMEALQGKRGPIQVGMFLIVNPPSWFDKVWQTMKPMLSTKFRTKVHMIPENKLDAYLASGYEKFLPQEFSHGQLEVASHVDDFIKYRGFVEDKVTPEERRPTKETKYLVRPKIASHPRRRASLTSSDPKKKALPSGVKQLRPSRNIGLGGLNIPVDAMNADTTSPSVSDEYDDSG